MIEGWRKPCPICGAGKGKTCKDDDGEDTPYVIHAGRLTGGKPLRVKHTGKFNSDGGAILETVNEEIDSKYS